VIFGSLFTVGLLTAITRVTIWIVDVTWIHGRVALTDKEV
jgi:hypothetical protein